MCQLWRPELDVGQMVAEMYELTLYEDSQAGLWLVEGFMSGYRWVSDKFAFRALLHTGTHLVGMGSLGQWDRPEKCERVAETGRDIILHAWKHDEEARQWLEKHDLSFVMAGSKVDG